jgi:hypothetical protein
LKGIPLELAHYEIELDISIPPMHEAKYKMNLNYTSIVKQDTEKPLVGFIQLVEKTSLISLIMVVIKKNGKLQIYVDFKNLNFVRKKSPYLLSFTYEVLNIVVGHEDIFLGYH